MRYYRLSPFSLPERFRVPGRGALNRSVRLNPQFDVIAMSRLLATKQSPKLGRGLLRRAYALLAMTVYEIWGRLGGGIVLK